MLAAGALVFLVAGANVAIARGGCDRTASGREPAAPFHLLPGTGTTGLS